MKYLERQKRIRASVVRMRYLLMKRMAYTKKLSKEKAYIREIRLMDAIFDNPAIYWAAIIDRFNVKREYGDKVKRKLVES
jgi:hypothetical protein